MSLDPSTTPSERTNEEAQSKIWNGFCQEMGLIDFLCVFVSPAHLSATRRKERGRKEGGESRKKKERPSEVILRDCNQAEGSFCRHCVSRANPSPQTEIHKGEHLRCSVLYGVLPACSPACLPDCSNIWQRSK